MSVRAIRAEDHGQQAGARNRRRRWRAAPRWMQVVNLVIFLGALVTIVVVLNYFAGRLPYRLQIDATKTRAYSLSDQTKRMLQTLPAGQWTMAMVMSNANVSRAARKQIDEVLRRYSDASPNIRVLKIDPDDPRTLPQYEQLLRDLQALYRDEIAAYDKALDDGVTAFKDLQVFSQQQAAALTTVARGLPQEDASARRLEQSAGALARIADEGDKVLDAVRAARRIDESQPIADYEGARSILAQWLTQSANEIDAVAGIFRSWLQRPNLEGGARTFASTASQAFEAMSLKLATAADPLKRLPTMDLGTIGEQLARGEAAVILGPPPRRAAVIPSSQLLPKSNLRSTRSGGIAFDQRFRGEQLISAAIRSLTVDQMPLVVFVHAEDDSLLRPGDRQADLTGVAAVLRASRYQVEEWNVAKSPGGGQRPQSQRGQKIVWVIVPPPPASSVQATPAASAMFEATGKLIAEGESVLLSVAPSLLAKYGQPDPFAMLAEPLGLTADTARIIFEQSPAARGESQISLSQTVQVFSEQTAIGRAVDGQQTEFSMPVPLQQRAGAHGGAATIHTIASIEPSPTRWLETDWTGNFTQREPRSDQRFSDPIPIALAAERSTGGAAGTQRFILVGSGGWMLTNVADQVVDIGGGRIAMINPGNHELMLASVAWLAGMDDLIAASPMSQEVSRLRGITPQVRAAWWWIIVAGVPLGCVLLGGLVWLWRRM